MLEQKRNFIKRPKFEMNKRLYNREEFEQRTKRIYVELEKEMEKYDEIGRIRQKTKTFF